MRRLKACGYIIAFDTAPYLFSIAEEDVFKKIGDNWNFYIEVDKNLYFMYFCPFPCLALGFINRYICLIRF